MPIEISHWAVVANWTTLIGKTAVIPIPDQDKRTVFLMGHGNGGKTPAVLMIWACVQMP
jgi:hypothetical protein